LRHVSAFPLRNRNPQEQRRVLSSHAARLPVGYDGAVGTADPMMSASRFAKALIASAKPFSSAVRSWVTA
jgi:hypothetical protein